MAHPLILAEVTFKQFILHWMHGYAPSIQITTNSDGSIRVNSVVHSSNMPTNFQSPSSSNRRCQRSGHSSRLRRRNNRSKKIQEQHHLVTDSASQTSEEPTFNEHLSPQVNDQICVLSAVDISVQVSVDTRDAACETVPTLEPRKPILTTIKNAPLSIPPRPVYHPAVINASKAFYQKHPCDLTKEEKEKFKFYLDYKRREGEPVETDIIYLPSTMRECLHCGFPT